MVELRVEQEKMRNREKEEFKEGLIREKEGNLKMLKKKEDYKKKL